MGHSADLCPAAAGARSATVCRPARVDRECRHDGALRWHQVHQGQRSDAGRSSRRALRCAGCLMARPASRATKAIQPRERSAKRNIKSRRPSRRASRFPPPNLSPVPRVLPARTAVPEPSAMPADGQYAADDGPAMFMGPGPDGPGIDGDGCADGCGPCRGGPCSRCCLPLPRNWVDSRRAALVGQRHGDAAAGDHRPLGEPARLPWFARHGHRLRSRHRSR